ncbi:MAG: hypothetical protein FWC71_01735 [Defluviitaleaceae bacterium]|nr:hypothetical protein [Defluviitaleaceae bacterium]
MEYLLQLPAPQIPQAFAMHPKIMQILHETVYEFNHEEQQAIYYYHFTGLSPRAIARVVELTEDHVVSALVLYAQRLNMKIDLFKKVEPYDESEMMQVDEILLSWSA